ncbi:golgin subfamily A member 2 isoform X1 [Nematostella vectensis]|uniref:golgin subfamily A member 2 isoform X1 n=1 Tax=Nematostella vectensis TaxID=45351 RepID=UPI00138FD7F9|nr:golgin subfamily A member 2 isoform X1 [Nematostella vectensis]
MADSDRDLKLAAARKRLKKFQQKRTPNSSPSVHKTSQNSPVVSTDSSTKSSNSSVPSSPINKTADKSFNHILLSPNNDEVNRPSSPGADNTGLEDNPQNNTKGQTLPLPSPTQKSVDKNHVTSLTNGSDVSTTEKIRQMCNQLNGLMDQDFPLNGEDPVISEIETLERRNHELEESLMSHKRSNEQLNNQVNEQRKQIINLQDQIKRERAELANRQLLEQRTLKEQLEVHIQTIGILVGEKQELQSTVSQLQRKYQTKESENSEISGRLQAVRQKIVELERNNASLSASLEKYQSDFNHTRQERDKYQTANYTYNREKEELAQQNAELKMKLEVKVNECEELERTTSDLSKKLSQAELIVQQLSIESDAPAAQTLVQQLQQEKDDLKSKLDQLKKTLQKSEANAEEALQRRTDELEKLQSQTRSLQSQLELIEKEKESWESRESELQEELQHLQKNLVDLEDEEVSHHVEATQQAAIEIEKLCEEKQKLAEHLQNQARENDKLVREEGQYLHRIHELEITVNRLEEEATDRASLLDSIQGDKETISRALKQNKELKTQLEEIEKRFVKMSEENMELATQLETEKHVGKEMAVKLSETAVELEETKESFERKSEELSAVTKECEALKKQLDNKSDQLSSLHDERELSLQNLQEQLKQKEFELSSLKEEVDTTKQFAEQAANQMNEQQQEYEDQLRKMEMLYGELQRSEDTIHQLVEENEHLRTVLDSHEDTVSEEGEASTSSEEVHYHDESPAKEEASDEEDPHIKPVPSDKLHTNEVLDNRFDVETPELYQQEGSYINGDLYHREHEETDSGEDMNMVPQRHARSPPPLSKYTSREDVIDGLSASIRQLELEREQMTSLLHASRENHENEMRRLRDHMDLQLQQQLKQQYKQVQEQFQQQLHEQQQKIQLLQEVLERQKARIEQQSEEEVVPAPPTEAEGDNMSFEALKIAFSKLQGWFMKLMEEKASLTERIQELEHLTVQLSEETETIGEYITLYQTQRTALKAYYHDREKLITQISNEKGEMQAKISQFQELVKQLLDERKELRFQQHQLQNMLNKRMLAHEHESIIPGYQEGDEIITTITTSDQESAPSEAHNNLSNRTDNLRESEVQSPGFETFESSGSESLESSGFELEEDDGTALQILQLLEQLGPSEEGNKGWVSPAVRTREFLPCRHCTSSRLLRI